MNFNLSIFLHIRLPIVFLLLVLKVHWKELPILLTTLVILSASKIVSKLQDFLVSS